MAQHRYFKLAEFTASTTARQLGIDNTPSKEIVSHIDELIDVILDPLREDYGKAMIVTSGYRCPKLNKAVGGSETSVHPLGYAADLQPANDEFDNFVRFVVGWFEAHPSVPFDQLLIEKNSRGTRWLHIGLKNRSGQSRRQVKTMNVV